MKPKIKTNLSLIFSVILCFLFYSIINSFTLSEDNKLFIEKINERLSSSNNTIFFSEIIEGDWKYICTTYDYERVSKIAAKKLQILPNEVEITKGVDTVATDYEWQYIIIYPPNKIEIYEIPTKYYVNRLGAKSGCIEKSFAKIKMSYETYNKKTYKTLELKDVREEK